MSNKPINNLKLGFFVLAGTALLIISLYLIGSKRNFFDNTITIFAQFKNVNGLMEGNNVRFAGIDVGTISKVEIINDTAVKVEMVIMKKIQEFIKNNAKATIGTDGLMGNKIVNINNLTAPAPQIEEGNVLESIPPIESDEMLRTLNTTNENVKTITENLKDITDKIKSRNNLWNLLLDTVAAENLKQALVYIKVTGANSATLTGDLSKLVLDVKNSKGLFGSLMFDTTLNGKIEQTIVEIKRTGEQTAIVSGDLSKVIKHINEGKGSVGSLIMDTTFAGKLNKSLENLEKGTGNFNENMEALKHSFLLRKYFRKKEKDALKKKP